MRVVAVEHVGAGELLATLRRTRLRGYDGARPYAHADLEIAAVDPDDLAPAQNYVLAGGVATALALRDALAPWGVDPLALGGAVRFTTDDGAVVPLLPPIVEASAEPDGRTVLLVNDGMHRVAAARRLGTAVSAVVIRGVPAAYPYYAYALPAGWPGVATLEALPDGHQKKDYRRPEAYRSLFRDFDALFPGVQAPRARTNPAHLHRG